MVNSGLNQEQFMEECMKKINLLAMSSEYAKLHNDLSVYHHLKSILSESAQAELAELSDAYSVMEAIAAKIYYQQGFLDGLNFIIQSLEKTIANTETPGKHPLMAIRY